MFVGNWVKMKLNKLRKAEPRKWNSWQQAKHAKVCSDLPQSEREKLDSCGSLKHRFPKVYHRAVNIRAFSLASSHLGKGGGL